MRSRLNTQNYPQAAVARVCGVRKTRYMRCLALIPAPDFTGQRHLADPAKPSPRAMALAPRLSAKTVATSLPGPTRASGCAGGRQAAHGAVATTATTAARCCARSLRYPRTPAVTPRTTGSAVRLPEHSMRTNVGAASSWARQNTSPDNPGRRSAEPGSDLELPILDRLCGRNVHDPTTAPTHTADTRAVDILSAHAPTHPDVVARKQ